MLPIFISSDYVFEGSRGGYDDDYATERIKPISLRELPGMEHFPLDTSMVCSRLIRSTNARFRPLDECIDSVCAAACPG